jgi:hypothetical protein
MPYSFSHIVHRQTFEIHVQTSENAREITDQLVDAYRMAMPGAEAVLNAYDDPDRIITIDKVYLDLGHLELKNFEEVFSARLQIALSSIVSSAKVFHGQPDYGIDGMSLSETNETKSISASSSESRNKTKDPSGADTCTIAEGVRRALLYFLANGVFPWWLSDNHNASVKEIFSPALDEASPVFIGGLKRLLARDRNALQRLVCQFPIVFLERLISLIRKNSSDKVESLYRVATILWDTRIVTCVKDDAQYQDRLRMMEILVAGDDNVSEMFIDHIRHWIDQRVFSFDDLRNVVTSDKVAPLSFDETGVLLKKIRNAVEKHNDSTCGDILNDVFTDMESVDTNDEEDNSKQSEDECIHVSHAGLVILHPFLVHFFDTQHLLNDDKQFLDESVRMRAVYLLGYLASEKEDASENELPFCKYLCGLPLKVALEKPVALHDETKEECQRLLQDVIRHWTALKGTSSSGFREAFLSRRGKLDFKEGNPVLYVERMAYDILLESLPWGISYVHLPWLKQPITTIWN